MVDPAAVAAPILPELDPCELPDGAELDELALSEARVEHRGRGTVTSRRIRIEESEMHGLTLGEGVATELRLADVRMEGCDLSTCARGAARSGGSS